MFADEIPAKVEAVALTGLRAAEWNPRTISDERFQNLCASIQADPDFLRHRPVLALADGTIYAGNMRYRAAEHLGFESVPAILEAIPEQLAKERAMRDNAQWGAWQEDELAALLASLRAEGSDLDLLGFEGARPAEAAHRLDQRDPHDLPDSPEEQPGTDARPFTTRPHVPGLRPPSDGSRAACSARHGARTPPVTSRLSLARR